MIGIIGAMEQEVQALKEMMTVVRTDRKAQMDFTVGQLLGKDVVVVRSGVGKVNAAVCTQILADDYKVAAVINTGVAGSLNPKIDIGDIVVSVDAVQHDVDAVVFGYEYGEVPQMKKRTFDADPDLRQLITDTCRRVNPDIHVHDGRVASGDQFVSDDARKAEIARRFEADCTEMEGCAIAQAAWLNGIPFVIIRAISDKADGSAQRDYDEFEAGAIAHTVRLLQAVIPEINAD